MSELHICMVLIHSVAIYLILRATILLSNAMFLIKRWKEHLQKVSYGYSPSLLTNYYKPTVDNGWHEDVLLLAMYFIDTKEMRIDSSAQLEEIIQIKTGTGI